MKYLRLVGLLIFVVLLVHLDLPAIFAVLSHARLPLLLIAIALNGFLVGLKAWRWQFLLGMQGQTYSVWRATVVYFSSLFAGFLTPGRVGEFVKALYLTQDTGMPVSMAMSSVLADRLLDLYALLVCGGYGLVVFSLPPDVSLVGKWVVLGVIAVSVLLVHPRAEREVCRTLERLPRVRRYTLSLVPRIHHFYAGMAGLWRPRLLVAALLTAAAYLVFFTQCYLLALALDLPLHFGFVVFAVSTTSLVALIPISISGLGTRDAILIALLNPLGIGAETAVAYSTFILVTFYVAAGGIGAIAWSAAPLNARPMKQTWPEGDSDQRG